MVRKPSMSGVTIITMDRPDRRNALDLVSCRTLANRFGEAVAGGARVIVLAGDGPHFCAGVDLTAVHDPDVISAVRNLVAVICDVPVPVIAAVQGAALGAGTQLALACDLRVVTPTARFGIPAARLGLMLDDRTVRRLALLAGHGPARAMLLGAQEIDAEGALRLGLAQRAGDLADAQAWADEIAALAPLTLAGHKLTMNRLESGPGGDVDVARAYDRAWASADAIEGLAAFRERRRPSFEGR